MELVIKILYLNIKSAIFVNKLDEAHKMMLWAPPMGPGLRAAVDKCGVERE